MNLFEITISRQPRQSADISPSTNKSDYADRLTKLKDRSGINDQTLDQLVANQDLEGTLDQLVRDDEVPPDEDLQVDGEDKVTPESTDPNKMGLIRVVSGAHLVYKRAMPDSTFSELWVYKAENVRDTMSIRDSILSGTDIEKTKLRSEDNTQTYDVWSVGNIEILSITGLPN